MCHCRCTYVMMGSGNLWGWLMKGHQSLCWGCLHMKLTMFLDC